jgi:hypothetical protein
MLVPEVATVESPIGLWTSGGLRGANIFGQQKYATTGAWSPVYKQQDFHDLRALGANFVDLSVPGPYDVRPPYARRLDFLGMLDRYIDYAAIARLYAVISCRTAPGRGEGDITGDGLSDRSLFSSSSPQSAFVTMWQEVASRYAGRAHVVGYDLLVEPQDVRREVWRKLAQRVVEAIRKVDPVTPILVSPHAGGVVSSLSTWTPIPGTVSTVHQYGPYRYTHHGQAADWQTVLKNNYAQIAAWRTEHNAVVTVNEFGVAIGVKSADLFISEQCRLLTSYGLGGAVWLHEERYDRDYRDTKFDYRRDPAILAEVKAWWAA